jgi:hypothetical protein
MPSYAIETLDDWEDWEDDCDMTTTPWLGRRRGYQAGLCGSGGEAFHGARDGIRSTRRQ